MGPLIGNGAWGSFWPTSREMIPADVGAILDADFGIATRVGLQCAPLVHQRLGTGRAGGVRFSLGPFNTAEQIDETVEAVKKIAQYRKT